MFIKLTIEKGIFFYLNVASIESIYPGPSGGGGGRILLTTSEENFLDVKETPEEIMVLIESLR